MVRRPHDQTHAKVFHPSLVVARIGSGDEQISIVLDNIVTYLLYSHAAHTFGAKRARSASGVDAAEIISRSAIGLGTLRNHNVVRWVATTTPQPMKRSIRSSTDARHVSTASIRQITMMKHTEKLNAVPTIHACLEEVSPVAHGGYSCVLMRHPCAF